MKKFWTILILFFTAAGLSYYAYHRQQALKDLSADLRGFASSTLATLGSVKEEILTPPPLIGGGNHQNSSLTVSGVIFFTNQNRKDNGNLRPLRENELLDRAAEAKLKDMFEKQYFEHESPAGKGPSDLAKAAGYRYILIGENLALGNFKDDEDLVTAWMNSPGHRANILKDNFEEIGVAVGQGMYEGKKTWMAVQEFGRPSSSCPAVDSSLKGEIGSMQNDIDYKQQQLVELKRQLDSADPKTPSEYNSYNQKVAEYNDLVHIYNNLVDTLKQKTNTYNSQVNAYNLCLGS